MIQWFCTKIIIIAYYIFNISTIDEQWSTDNFIILHKVLGVNLHDLPTAGSSMNTSMVIVIFCINIVTYKKIQHIHTLEGWTFVNSNREIKFDVTWSYVKRQTAKMTSGFVFFSSNPSLNHIKIEKCLLLFATNTNVFTLLFKELKTDGKSFIFAVCRLR